MSLNPFINALLAALYIVAIVFVIDTFSDSTTDKATMLVPMTMLSLLVLSVAVMGFLFGYKPITLYLENQKQEAVVYFAKTVTFFACFAALFVISLLYTLF